MEFYFHTFHVLGEEDVGLDGVQGRGHDAPVHELIVLLERSERMLARLSTKTIHSFLIPFSFKKYN
jgi:hypothetical protein